MREHYRLVLSQSRRMLGVTEDAEDVTQAVFVKTWKAWDGFEGNAAQRRAWLLRITRNATVDAARKRNLRRMAPLDVLLEERTAEVLDSPDFEGDAILARLHAAISTLPPKQRWVFQARYLMIGRTWTSRQRPARPRGIESILSPRQEKDRGHPPARGGIPVPLNLTDSDTFFP